MNEQTSEGVEVEVPAVDGARGDDAAWADVARRLVRALAARGVDAETAAELAQETCARVLAADVFLPSVDDLYRYARRVALNLLVGLYRRPRWGWIEGIPEPADPVDVGVRVEARLLLAAVWDRLAALSPSERQAIVYEVVGRPAWDDREREMWKMRRCRARDKLRMVAELPSPPSLRQPAFA